MNVVNRKCIKKFEVTAKNGDHFETEVGQIYTCSDQIKNGKTHVFSTYWLWIPEEYFEDAILGLGESIM